MFRNKKNKQKSSGFTLVEMLVAIAVFMSVMVVAVTALISIVNANRKSQAIKSVVDNVTFAIDSISRDMRSGSDYRCGVLSQNSLLTGSGDCTGGNNGVQYINPSGGYIQYRFVSTDVLPLGDANIQKRSCSGINNCSVWQAMTAPISNVNITNMKFYVLGSDTSLSARGSRIQPRVIITLEGVAGDDAKGTKTTFQIQTTVSQSIRNNGI
ncbi:MAG: type II secretion system protein [Candidatus Taylorbacteria bacterium]|nr:type II secretion system protein [Candidatus Taylorbacteria bacterium]